MGGISNAMQQAQPVNQQQTQAPQYGQQMMSNQSNLQPYDLNVGQYRIPYPNGMQPTYTPEQQAMVQQKTMGMPSPMIMQQSNMPQMGVPPMGIPSQQPYSPSVNTNSNWQQNWQNPNQNNVSPQTNAMGLAKALRRD